MKVIKEYILEKHTLAPQSIYLPKGAQIFNVVNTSKGLALYALSVSAELDVELRDFKICNTNEIFYCSNVKYLGYFESDTGIQHVIELL